MTRTIQIGHFVAHDHTVEHGGFRTVLWKVPKDLMAAIEDVVVFLNYLQKCHRELSQGATAQLLVMCNRSCAQPAPAAWLSGSIVWRAQNSHNLVSGGGNRTNCSCCPDGVWFPQRGPSRCLSGRPGRLFWESHSGAYKSNPTHVHCLPHWHGWDDLDGSNASGLSLWVSHSQKQASPVSWACARTLGCRSCPRVGPDTPFTSQDKPPLAIAMVVTLNGVRSLGRYRLVIARKSKLRLTQEVTAALASHSRDHRLTASGFFPCSIDREYLYGYAGDGYRSPLWLCVSHNGSPVLVHRLRGNKIHFHQATKDRRILLIPGIIILLLTDYNHCCCRLPPCKFTWERAFGRPWRGGKTVEDPSSDEERATTDGESEVEAEAEESDLPPEEPWCPPIPDAPDDPTEWKSQVLLTSWQPWWIVLDLKPTSSSNLTTSVLSHTCGCRLNLPSLWRPYKTSLPASSCLLRLNCGWGMRSKQ